MRASRCEEALTRPGSKSRRVCVLMDYNHSFNGKTIEYNLPVSVYNCTCMYTGA